MELGIRFDIVSKTFDGKAVLDGLSFQIPEGRFVGLIGNNGCGKTTTLKILCNLISRNSGDTFILGNQINPGDVEFKRDLGIVLSEPFYIPDFSVERYLKFVCRFQSISKGEATNRISDLSSILGFVNDLQIPIKKLSAGTQMKVSIAAALIHNPKILALDEPFVNLDPGTTQVLTRILKSFKGNKTALISSHNLDLVIDLCDEFLILDKGVIALNLRREDFISTQDLKEKVASVLANDSQGPDISWLA